MKFHRRGKLIAETTVQLRVMGNSCVIPDDFKQEIKFCFADWSANFDDTTPYGLYNQNVTNDTAYGNFEYASNSK
jgi:hypothetical protein